MSTIGSCFFAGIVTLLAAGEPVDVLQGVKPPLANVVPPVISPEHMYRGMDAKAWQLPIAVAPFEEHVRAITVPQPGGQVEGLVFDEGGNLVALGPDGTYRLTASGQWEQGSTVGMLGPIRLREALRCAKSAAEFSAVLQNRDLKGTVTGVAELGATWWLGTEKGLYSFSHDDGLKYHESYGVDGPLATTITALAKDSKGTLWVGTPVGLSRMQSDGTWSAFTGRNGMPIEAVTDLVADSNDRLWIGTAHGLIQYRPYEKGRQWFYRAGKRYLPNDLVQAIAVSADAKTVYTLTAEGIGRIDVKTTTLLEKAQTIEKLVNERHRRFGLVAECVLDNAENPTSHRIDDNDNDGLWTAYHVGAMSLCYGATKDEAAKQSAHESMHALYMLQNASGTPGLVARSVVPISERASKNEQWRETPDGKLLWKSDTSSDEIDGHYFAFYTYYEHIAQHDPEEKALIEKQVRALTDYLLANDYQLIDWDGERTRWGFWDPKAINDTSSNFLENGLNSLQMLSFLRVTHYITGDEKYLEHYRKLIVEHRYLSNVLLTKKVFPDDNNHSDDQLGFVAWYPIVQIEHDPVIRAALLGGLRRHYMVVASEQPSFYTFVYATIDPIQADLEGAIENLRQIPTDRRQWPMINSIRADVQFADRGNRFDKPVLTHVLPADERSFSKWNGDPYEPDRGDGEQVEDDGAAYLLPYWMGRFHGFIVEGN
ncbi:MAG: hypothetical protein K1Y02_03945 [Candidatus Hydrogenedentes bacterium]|nr:hypothetical protein [Candidatus Hydrogenedentota bacterium]